MVISLELAKKLTNKAVGDLQVVEDGGMVNCLLAFVIQGHW